MLSRGDVVVCYKRYLYGQVGERYTVAEDEVKGAVYIWMGGIKRLCSANRFKRIGESNASFQSRR